MHSPVLNIFFRNAFHILTVVTFLCIPLIFFYDNVNFNVFIRLQLIVAFTIPFYFLNITYFIPKFLKKGYYTSYTIFIFLSIALVGLLLNPLLDFSGLAQINAFPPSVPIREKLRAHSPIFPLLIYYTLGTSFEMILESEKQKNQKREAEKEKIYAELSFLKSQVNPHFLFNSLNNIYSLAVSKSEDTCKAILLLSDMMRYMLYESGEEKVNLEKEITYIKNYITLQELRLSKNKDIKVTFEVKGNTPQFKVAPMLFIPFIENAFKHGISYNNSSFVKINLTLNKNCIDFTVCNTKHHNHSATNIDKNMSGVGLKNIKRRLELLYPKNHKLEIKTTEGNYAVSLQLFSSND